MSLIQKNDPFVLLNTLGIAVATFNDEKELAVEPIGFEKRKAAYIGVDNKFHKNLIRESNVIVTRAEGLGSDKNVGRPQAAPDFYAANRILSNERHSVPEGDCYKCDIEVFWPNEKKAAIQFTIGLTRPGYADIRLHLHNLLLSTISRIKNHPEILSRNSTTIRDKEKIALYILDNYAVGQTTADLTEKEISDGNFFVIHNYSLGDENAENTNQTGRALYNCMTHYLEPDWDNYTEIQATGCKLIPIDPVNLNGDRIVETGIARKDAEFFSIYGKTKSGEWEAITDQDNYDTACAIGRHFEKTKGVPFSADC